MSELRTYEGNCHCGLVKFSVQLPALESLHACDCSICTKKGYLFVFAPKSAITVTKGGGTDGLGADVLVSYIFGRKQLEHRFCGTCGVGFGIVNTVQGAPVALNARLFLGLDLWALPVQESKPQNDAPYVPPVFPGLAALQVEPLDEGEKIYPGSCHCGAVTFALKSPWLLEKKGPEDMENNVAAECNCSTCIRHASIYTYPRPLTRVPQAAAPEALAEYFSVTGNKFVSTQFCRVCGCVVGLRVVGPPNAASLPARVQEIIKKKCDMRPVQVRALDVVLGLNEDDRGEWERVKGAVKRSKGSEEGKPYVVPE
ncbi:Mss4-like protein [Roridomyces roridus]|uniref:Mss4-like protein n=1 Tax=Roridomyces roridus TaxID=1738132 RepID=A0AAD7BQS0_9AGAR|nr:Mss4-like protein [Roridomyces roridus]